ncbi:MAG: hypothetical protein Q8S33_05300 [Myxococcales bacterium]|nr:hypothetical protein [Myxococcales bacterium]
MLAVPLDIEADPQIAVARGAVMPRMQLDCGAVASVEQLEMLLSRLPFEA